MKLTKALKEKNKLVREINGLFGKMQAHNSKPLSDVNKSEYNTAEIYIKLLVKKGKLINLKTKINKANLNIAPLIYELSEAKDTISKLQSISTFEGINHERFSVETSGVEYCATISEKEMDEKIEFFNGVIEKLQEDIDTYNATTEIDFE